MLESPGQEAVVPPLACWRVMQWRCRSPTNFLRREAAKISHVGSQWVQEQGTRPVLTADMGLLTALLWPSVTPATRG